MSPLHDWNAPTRDQSTMWRVAPGWIRRRARVELNCFAQALPVSDCDRLGPRMVRRQPVKNRLTGQYSHAWPCGVHAHRNQLAFKRTSCGPRSSCDGD